MNNDIIVKVGADISDLGRGMANATKEIKGFGDRMGDFGSRMQNHGQQIAGSFGVMSLAVGGALGIAVKKSADFDTAMRKAGAIAGASADEFDAMRESALKLGADTSKSATEVANAMTDMAAKGFTANQVIAAMPGIIAASEASGEDLALAADTVATALNIFGLEAAEASRVADVLSMSANVSAAGINDLGEVLKYAGAPAAALGISLEEVTAAAGLMVDAGLNGSNAGTALRQSLLALNNPAKAQSKIMENLGFSLTDSAGNAKSLSEMIRDMTEATKGMTEADKVATLGKLVGTEAVSGFLALMKAGPDAIDANTDALRNSGGVAQETADKMMSGIGGALEQLSGALETLAIRIGDELVPYVQAFAEKVTALIEKFNGLSPAVKQFIAIGGALFAGLTGLVAVFGTVLAFVGLVASGIGSLIAVFTPAAAATTATAGATTGLGAAMAAITGPIGIAVAAVAGIIAVLVLAYKNVDWFRDMVNDAWTKIKSVSVAVFNEIKSVISSVISSVVNFVKAQLDKFRGFWEENGTQILSIVAGAFNLIMSNIRIAMAVITGIFQTVWPVLKAIVSVAWGAIKMVISQAITLILGIIQTVLKVLKGDWSGAWETIKKTAFSMMGDVVKFLSSVDLKQIGIDIMKGLIKGITSMVTGIYSAVKDIANSIPEWAKKILGIHSPSRVMMAVGKDTGEGLIVGIASKKTATQQAMQGLVDVIKSVTNTNAKEITEITRKQAEEEKAIRAKADKDIEAIYANAKANKRKITVAESHRIQKIEADEAAKIKSLREKSAKDLAKIEQSAGKERLDAIKQYVSDKKALEQISLIDEVNMWRKSVAYFKDGTEEKVAAQIQYKNALQAVQTEITSINETYAGKMQSINDKLRADEEALTKTYTDTLNSRMQALMSFAGLFDAFDVKVEQSGAELLSNLQSQVDGFKLWSEEIEKLAGKAIDEGLLAELREMGPKALPQLLALNSMTDEQLKEYSGLYAEKSKLAREQAETELVGMKEDTAKRITELRATANKELDVLRTEWVAKIQAVTKATNDEFLTLTQIGKNAGQNLLNGLASMEGALVAQARAIAQAVNAALQSTLGGSVSVAPYSVPSTSSGVSTGVRTSSVSASAGGTTFTGPMNVTIDAKSVKELGDLTKLFDKQTINRR